MLQVGGEGLAVLAERPFMLQVGGGRLTVLAEPHPCYRYQVCVGGGGRIMLWSPKP